LTEINAMLETHAKGKVASEGEEVERVNTLAPRRYQLEVSTCISQMLKYFFLCQNFLFHFLLFFFFLSLQALEFCKANNAIVFLPTGTGELSTNDHPKKRKEKKRKKLFRSVLAASVYCQVCVFLSHIFFPALTQARH
jgi:hypothetical protein